MPTCLPLKYIFNPDTMPSQYSWMTAPRRISRRFTTLEGWREIGGGVYVVGSNFRAFAIEHQFDPENYNDDRTSWTRPSRSASGTSEYSGIQPWWNGNDARFSNAISGTGSVRDGKDVIEEKPYHVFTQREKWTVVGMIGVAGLFSGLSSNIYFPSLDAIAKVGASDLQSITRGFLTKGRT